MSNRLSKSDIILIFIEVQLKERNKLTPYSTVACGPNVCCWVVLAHRRQIATGAGRQAVP